ncbi:MAG: hypothetical protein ACPGR7_04040 [Flavobacteriaceae bacterium]
MKKLLLLFFVFASFISTQAQENKHISNAEMAVKKMTLRLDLSEKQADQITPLIENQIEFMQALKTTEMQRDEKQLKVLDQKIAFQRSMKRILDENQYEEFRNLEKRSMKKRRKR